MIRAWTSALFAAILLAGCVSARPSEIVTSPTGAYADVGSFTLAVDVRATPAQARAAAAYVERYAAHWAPFLERRSGQRLRISVTAEVWVHGTPANAARDLDAAYTALGLDLTTGAVRGAEWEIPLLAQGLDDPTPPFAPPGAGAWGAWGPIFAPDQTPRQTASAVAWTR